METASLYSLKDIDQNQHVIYKDDDIVLIKDVQAICRERTKHGVRYDFFIFLLCLNGELTIEVQSQQRTVKKNQILHLQPNSLLKDCQTNPDSDIHCICISTFLIQKMQRNNRRMWKEKESHYVINNPVSNINPENKELFEYYYTFLKYRLNLAPRIYDSEVLHAVMSAAIFDLFAGITSSNTPVGESQHQYISRSNILFNRFIELLSQSTIKKQQVSYYSNQLCITPKYLSCICKRISGKSAYDWINEYLIEDIRILLKHSEYSIKEIAHQLGFSNLSFFGKFVKTHLGVSPTEFRRTL